MSYLRFGARRQWTEGESIYAFPSVNGTVTIYEGDFGQVNVRFNDWIEVSMHILERSGEFDRDELDRIRRAMHHELIGKDADKEK